MNRYNLNDVTATSVCTRAVFGLTPLAQSKCSCFASLVNGRGSNLSYISVNLEELQ